jgi:Tol biopolymer transport system component
MTTESRPAWLAPTAIVAISWLLLAGACPAADDLGAELKKLDAKIVYESFENDNWDLFVSNADGSQPRNLTRTPDVDELYPHVSPDGTKISFLVDEGQGPKRARNLYLMDADGTDRILVARNARDQCFNGDGTQLAYLKGEYEEYCLKDYATKGLWIYDLKTGRHREHPNKELFHLYNLCWAPDGKWFVSTVHAGMGFKHAILAIEANGPKVVNLGLPGCRPDLSHDGRRIAWGASDYALRIAEIDFSQPEPKVTGARDVVTSTKPMEVYHVDWSPDGRYVAFSRGPKHKGLGMPPEMVGVRAEGWNISVADADATNRYMAITTSGHSHKEPDWVPMPRSQP